MSKEKNPIVKINWNLFWYAIAGVIIAGAIIILSYIFYFKKII
jgi:hypothetical protein